MPNKKADQAKRIGEAYFNEMTTELSDKSEQISTRWWAKVGHIDQMEKVLASTLAYALVCMATTIVRNMMTVDAASARALKKGLMEEMEKSLKPEAREPASPWKVTK